MEREEPARELAVVAWPWTLAYFERMRRLLAFLLLTTASAAAPVLACSSDSRSPSVLVVSDDDSGPTKSKTDAKFDAPGQPPPDGSAGPSRVYAHTKDTLYLFDSASKKATSIGKLSCLSSTDSIIDIAIDRTGAMFGTTYEAFISIDPISASCSIIASGTSYPNSLSFVPAGTVDAAKEALVGYAYNASLTYADRYVRIDTATGAITELGNLNAPGAPTNYGVSGDLISLIQASNKAYVTVNAILADGGPDDTMDYLAEVNPATGRLVNVLGPAGAAKLYGLGYWAGTGYGFGFDGRVVALDMTNGSSTVVTTLTVDGGTGAWYGAGVTTQAPTAP